MRTIFLSFLVIVFSHAKVVLSVMSGQRASSEVEQFTDDEKIISGSLQYYTSKSVAIEARVESSENNKFADGSSTDIERYSLNLLHEFAPSKKISPYVMVGVGNEKFHRVFLKYKSGSFNQIGAGLKVALNDKLELITEIRGINRKSTKEIETVLMCGLGYKFGINEECLSKKQVSKKVIKPLAIPKEVTHSDKVRVAKDEAHKLPVSQEDLIFSDEVILK